MKSDESAVLVQTNLGRESDMSLLYMLIAARQRRAAICASFFFFFFFTKGQADEAMASLPSCTIGLFPSTAGHCTREVAATLSHQGQHYLSSVGSRNINWQAMPRRN